MGLQVKSNGNGYVCANSPHLRHYRATAPLRRCYTAVYGDEKTTALARAGTSRCAAGRGACAQERGDMRAVGAGAGGSAGGRGRCGDGAGFGRGDVARGCDGRERGSHCGRVRVDAQRGGHAAVRRGGVRARLGRVLPLHGARGACGGRVAGGGSRGRGRSRRVAGAERAAGGRRAANAERVAGCRRGERTAGSGRNRRHERVAPDAILPRGARAAGRGRSGVPWRAPALPCLRSAGA